MLDLFNINIEVPARFKDAVGLMNDLGKASISAAMEQQNLQDMFVARTGSGEIGTAMFDKFRAEAVAAGEDVNESLQSSLTFLPSVQNAGQITQLNDAARHLSAFDSSGKGMTGAAEAIKEALSGNLAPLSEGYSLPEKEMQAFNLDDLGQSGNIDGFIKAFDQLLEKEKMGQEAFDQMMKSPTKQLEILTNNMEAGLAGAGERGAETLSAHLSSVLLKLNNAFQEGKFQPFFDGLSMGVTIVAQGIAGIVDVLAWLGEGVEQNWNVIEPILAMIGSALALWALTQIPLLYTKLGLLYAQLCLQVAPILEAAAAWLLMNWPILLVGAAIGFLLYAMLNWGDTTANVIGYIGGLIGMLFSFIYNKLAYFVNGILSVAEFICNVFIDPVNAVKKLFYDLAVNALGYIRNLASGIQALLDSMGIKIDITAGMDNFLKTLKEERESLKSEAGLVSLPRLEQMDSGDAFSKGQEIGQGFGKSMVNSVQGAYDSLSKAFTVQGGAADSADKLDKWRQDPSMGQSQIPAIDRVNEVGRINNTVDISSEDLKTMRELAEMKNIQNFVTLTPTVSVTTGDITNEQSVDSIIVKLKTMLETEISSSAQGVYA
ncbi:hypothetical protein Desor_5387 [Desulfosporosinus orientis DSM 765]|uniref:Uncharacterized protein n=1 Tax=Desulfosporosinus orientis (strain ATCC 19365 / DSM 765 / NCIMB 8382 / VKM B-1628 / Singapore I) TaxID=768706 RepID=G7WEF0_DESOD|nr:hypothetical protein [Desulfosporosinus orientis]AET70763.1 hypothetical protein Desor_5387 [Desulfosporosinus orientis DSM 765]